MDREVYFNKSTLVCSIHKVNVEAKNETDILKVKIKDEIFKRLISMPLEEYYTEAKAIIINSIQAK